LALPVRNVKKNNYVFYDSLLQSATKSTTSVVRLKKLCGVKGMHLYQIILCVDDGVAQIGNVSAGCMEEGAANILHAGGPINCLLLRPANGGSNIHGTVGA
jgi:hypothetical protein